LDVLRLSESSEDECLQDESAQQDTQADVGIPDGVFHDSWFLRTAGNSHKKGATCRTLSRGTAKRLIGECSKPRRVARAWAGSPI
jgi:hypothetical protein